MSDTTFECMDVPYAIRKTRYSLYVSYRTDDNTDMVTAATEEACRFVTDNIHIPVLKGCFEGYTSVPRSATVGEKL